MENKLDRLEVKLNCFVNTLEHLLVVEEANKVKALLGNEHSNSQDSLEKVYSGLVEIRKKIRDYNGSYHSAKASVQNYLQNFAGDPGEKDEIAYADVMEWTDESAGRLSQMNDINDLSIRLQTMIYCPVVQACQSDGNSCAEVFSEPDPEKINLGLEKFPEMDYSKICSAVMPKLRREFEVYGERLGGGK